MKAWGARTSHKREGQGRLAPLPSFPSFLFFPAFFFIFCSFFRPMLLFLVALLLILKVRTPTLVNFLARDCLVSLTSSFKHEFNALLMSLHLPRNFPTGCYELENEKHTLSYVIKMSLQPLMTMLDHKTMLEFSNLFVTAMQLLYNF